MCFQALTILKPFKADIIGWLNKNSNEIKVNEFSWSVRTSISSSFKNNKLYFDDCWLIAQIGLYIICVKTDIMVNEVNKLEHVQQIKKIRWQNGLKKNETANQTTASTNPNTSLSTMESMSENPSLKRPCASW